MEQIYKAVNLPKVGHEFNYAGNSYHFSVDDKSRYTLWRQYSVRCESLYHYDNIEEGLIAHFGTPQRIMYNDKPVFFKKIEAKPGQIYISHNKYKWLVIGGSCKLSLVSIPEFYLQQNFKDLSKEDMAKKLEDSNYVLSDERFQ